MSYPAPLSGYADAVAATKAAGGPGGAVDVVSTPTSVATPSSEHARLCKLWSLPRTLMQGTRGMRLAGPAYLPKEAAETPGAYSARLQRTVLFNGFRKTIKDMVGKVFQREVTLEDDVPDQLKQWSENIDLAGRHLNVMARDVLFDGMQTGINYLLVEMPPALPEGATRADEKAAGARPYLVHVKAEDLIGFKSEIIAGVVTLTQARIRETVALPAGAYNEMSIEQIRVLEPGTWQTWRKGTTDATKETWILFEEGVTSVDYIPLVPVYIHRTGFFIGEPPLEDLADLNVLHWQAQSDLRNIAHVVNVPILFGAGFDAEAEIAVGASSMVRTSAVGATLEYVTHDGAAITVTRDLLKDIELQMQVQGLQLLLDGPGGQTATGEVRDEAKENSPLAMMAMALGDALEQAFGYMADFAGIAAAGDDEDDHGGSVDVNTDFGVGTGSGIDMTTLLQSAVAKLISGETYRAELKRRDILADSFDEDVEKDRLETEVPDLPDPGPGNGMDLTDPAAPKAPAVAAKPPAKVSADGA